MRAITLLAAIGLSVALAATAWAHGGPELNVAGAVRPGGPIRIVGEDLTPNGVQTLVLRRAGAEPVDLGKVPTDDDGGFTATYHVPDTLPVGFYQLAAEGRVSAATQVELTVPNALAADLPRAASGIDGNAAYRRPVGETWGLALLVALVALGGAGLLWNSRSGAGHRS